MTQEVISGSMETPMHDKNVSRLVAVTGTFHLSFLTFRAQDFDRDLALAVEVIRAHTDPVLVKSWNGDVSAAIAHGIDNEKLKPGVVAFYRKYEPTVNNFYSAAIAAADEVSAEFDERGRLIAKKADAA